MRNELLETRRSRTVGGPRLALASERDERAEGSESVAGSLEEIVATRVVGGVSAPVVALNSAGAVVTSRTTRSQQSAGEAVATGAAFAAASATASQQHAFSTSPEIRAPKANPTVAVASATSGSNRVP